MDIVERKGGWQPDLPDHRDYTVKHPAIRKLMRGLQSPYSRSEAPSRVDWREYCPPVEEQGALPTGCAHACVALVQHFERRSTGRMIRPSRLFIHSNAERMLGQPADHSVSLRAVLKALVLFGSPPEEHWPYDPVTLARRPTSFVYGFPRRFRKARFLRLDARRQNGKETLRLAKSFLAAGLPFVLGFPVSTAVTHDAEIPYPAVFNSIRTGAAALAVGYDDDIRILSDKGAILIRNSWGTDWGDHGYGWLPYSFILERLAIDLWTLIKRSWLKSGEFHLPE